MRRALLFVTLFTLGMAFTDNRGQAQSPSTPAGTWTGSISLPNAKLEIILKLNRGETGQWTGTMDIPAQGGRDIALGTIAVEGKSVSFLMLGSQGNPTFKGTLSDDGAKIAGTFSQGGGSFPFEVARSAGRTTQTTGNATRVEGRWQGTLNTGAVSLRLVLRVSRVGSGVLAELDSPDQGATGLLIDTLSVEGDTVKLRSNIGASFEGALNADGSRITGTFTQGGGSLPLILEKYAGPAATNRPQEPRPPFPYNEETVAYRNESANIRLAGTLTLPKSGGPFRAVLLISGSGPQDRDGTIAGHKPFLVLADDLTRKGFAVLRVDDRGVGGSDLGPSNVTTEDFALDVLAGIQYLKGRREIDPRKIGLIGHSEGGVIAPMVAAKSSDVSFIVLMGGSGVAGDEILKSQSALVMKAQGVSDELIAWDRSVRQRVYNLIKSEPDGAVDAARRNRLMAEIVPEYLSRPTGVSDEAAARNALGTLMSAASNPWFRFFLSYDPKPALTKVACPVLAIGGDNDLQVPVQENLAAIESALKAGGNKNYTIRRLPKLNHLFQTSTTGSPTEYAAIEETISPAVLELLSSWIQALR